jgi:hypothetical protein
VTEHDIEGRYDPPLDDEDREAADHGETLADDGTPGAPPPEEED